MYTVTAYKRENGYLTHESFVTDALIQERVYDMILEVMRGDKSNYIVITNNHDGNKVFIDRRNMLQWVMDNILKEV